MLVGKPIFLGVITSPAPASWRDNSTTAVPFTIPDGSMLLAQPIPNDVFVFPGAAALAPADAGACTPALRIPGNAFPELVLLMAAGDNLLAVDGIAAGATSLKVFRLQ